MDLHCPLCGRSFAVDARPGASVTCPECGRRLALAPGPASNIHLTCANCAASFTVSGLDAGGEARCPSCGETVNPYDGRETVLMSKASAPASPLAEAPVDPLAKPQPNGSQTVAAAVSLGGYRLREVLERGPLGTRFRGEQVNLGREVAVDVMDRALGEQPARARAYLEEARKVAGLDHPSIPAVYDVGTDRDRHFVVSALVHGETLFKRFEDGRLFQARELARMGSRIAAAMATAHAKGVFHWSVSPSNLEVDARGGVHVLHFGLARALFVGGVAGPSVHKGAFEFCLAPELFQGREADARTDLYGLGATLYMALTGAHPYPAEAWARLVRGEAAPAPAAPGSLVPKVPDEMGLLLRELLAPDPDRRPGSAASVAQRLDALGRKRRSARVALSEVPPVAEEQKRKYRRLATDIGVSVQRVRVPGSRAREVETRLKDLSENGAFVVTDAPAPVGSFVKLGFAPSGTSSRVQVLGVVRWRDDRPGRLGMGVQFIEVSAQDRNRVEQYVRRREAAEMVQSVSVGALHRRLLRTVVGNWDRELSMEELVRGTGASRQLFERTLEDFERAGLVRRKQDSVVCVRPANETVRTAILDMVRATRA